jgi:metal-responsive CopG/Arc/MetJ family transcriptional regulator
MKVAISIPDDLFESAETLGKRLGVPRSRLYATAIADFVAKHRGRKVTEVLDRLYGAEESHLDSRVRRVQRRSIERNTW